LSFFFLRRIAVAVSSSLEGSVPEASRRFFLESVIMGWVVIVVVWRREREKKSCRRKKEI